MMAGLLSTSDIAHTKGWDRRTAWRWLTTLEREYGAQLVRTKRGLFISDDEMRQAVARMPPRNESTQNREIAQLRRRVSSLEVWKKATESELREFRRVSHEWLMKRR